MHYSGILVRSRPANLDQCVNQVDACAGAEVYLTDRSSSSLVVVLETETLGQQESTLRALQDLPQVATADLVYHYFDDATAVEGEVTACQH